MSYLTEKRIIEIKERLSKASDEDLEKLRIQEGLSGVMMQHEYPNSLIDRIINEELCDLIRAEQHKRNK